MKNPTKRRLALAIALIAAAGPASAVLERVGPSDPAPNIGGFPAWYQDTTGLALEFCDPKNQAELDGGWCLLLPGDVGALPESFPGNFFDEHFWFAAGAGMTPASGGKALLTLAVEAAFAADVVPGGQVAFSRIRVVLNPVPMTGTYRIIHPYGEEVVHAVAGARIFITDDVGINCPPGQFDCATQSRLGPFLLPSNVPGGAELMPVAGPVAGKLYIADPNRLGPVTGSPLAPFKPFGNPAAVPRDHNIFRIEGPAGSRLGTDPATGVPVDYIETTDFSLMGRVFTNTLPSRITVNRASYERDTAGATKVDVFASAFTTTQGRLPAQVRPVPVEPQLSFFAAPCGGSVDALTGEVRPPYTAPVGVAEVQMYSSGGGLHWAQAQPATPPAAVCVKDATARDVNGNIVPTYHPRRVTDEVEITGATYDGASGVLTVSATSSDMLAPPLLSAAFGGYYGAMAGGQLSLSSLMGPPSAVRVFSAGGGTAAHTVRSLLATTPPAGLPIATNDAFAFLEDSPTQNLVVLGNDSNVTGGSVAITALPRLGTAVLKPDGSIDYTPALNANGTDLLTYTVTVGTQVSNTGTVTINLTPVNDPPTAVADAANAVVGTAQQISVLTNDSDPDGAGDLVVAQLVTLPAAGATVSGGAGGVFNFLASAAGTYTFTYLAQDAAGVTSSVPATVTVQVSAGETLAIARAEYIVSKGRLRAQGTLSPVAQQTVRLDFINSAGTVLGYAGTATTDATGLWQLDVAVPLPSGANRLRATSSNGTVRTGALSIK